MAAFVQSNKAATSSATSLNCSFLSNVGVGGFLVASARTGGGGGTPSASDSFGSYSSDLTKADTPGDVGTIFHKGSVAGGADTVAVSIGVAASIRFSIHEYSGMGAATVGQTNSAALPNTASGVTAPSGNITTTLANALIFGFVIDDNSGVNASWTVTSGWNARETIVGSDACAYSNDLIVSATGTYQNAPAPGTATSNTPASLVISFQIPDAAVAGSVVPVRIPNRRVGPMALRRAFRRAIQIFSSPSGGPQAIAPTGITATSNVTGTVTALKLASGGSINASSSVSGTVAKRVPIVPAAVNATSTVTGTVTAKKAITGSVNATSTVTASLQALRAVKPTALNMTSAVTGAVTALHHLAPAAINATSTLSAAVSKQGSIQLAPAAINATSTLSASLQMKRALAPAVILSTSTVTASLAMKRLLSGMTINATSTVGGSLTRSGTNTIYIAKSVGAGIAVGIDRTRAK